MTPAIVWREREAVGRRCCSGSVASVDASETARKLRMAFGAPVFAKATRLPETFLRHGLYLMRYAFELQLDGFSWIGSGRPSDAELLNPENWRSTVPSCSNMLTDLPRR